MQVKQHLASGERYAKVTVDYPSNDEHSRSFGGHIQKCLGFLGSCSHSYFENQGVSLLTSLCFLGRRAGYRPAHCWFQRLSR